MKVTFSFVFAFFYLTLNAHANLTSCQTDEQFKKLGWSVTASTSLIKQLKELENWRTNVQNDFVDDLTGNFFSSVAKKYLRVKSYDYLKTPQNVMYGDVVYFFDHNTDKVVEVRWFANGRKHIMYDTRGTPCAANLIPIPDNTLL